MARPGALALCALAALSLALLAAPSAFAACPTTCSAGVSLTTITSPAGFLVNSGASISSCRRTCRYNGAPYYGFASADGIATCTCFRTCNTTGRVPINSGPITIGYGPACADIQCPVECEAPLGGTFITSPDSSSSKTNVLGARDCATFCNGKGLFYTYQPFTDKTCKCYTACNSTNTLTITPQVLGYVNACVGLPIVRPSKCSALLGSCPAKGCPGQSRCTSKSTKPDGVTKYQCCCNPPNIPTVVKGLLKGCAPPPQ